MARRTFQQMAISDEAILAMSTRGQPAKSAGMPRWIGGLSLVAGLTLAGAYYLPLLGTHQKLVTEYTELAHRTEGLEKELSQARADLAAATSKIEELLSRQKSAITTERARGDVVARTKSDLSAALAPRIQKGAVALGGGEGRLSITISDAFTPKDVAPAARAAICDAAETLSARNVTVTIVARAGEDSGSKSGWDVASGRAAAVARLLEQKCGYPRERISTAVKPAAGSSGADTVELQIDSGAH